MVPFYNPDHTIGLILTPIAFRTTFGSSKSEVITTKLEIEEKYHFHTHAAGMGDGGKKPILFDTGSSAEDSISSLADFPEVVLKNNLNHFKVPFPLKVQEMLEDVEKHGNSHIVSWLPHGKSFRVHKEEEFVAYILPCYFNQSKLTSFTRQLYMYSFQKVQDGPDQGAFFHEKFIRGNKSLCQTIKRKKDKKLSHSNRSSTSPTVKSSGDGTSGGSSARRGFVVEKVSPVNLPHAHANVASRPSSMNGPSIFSQMLPASTLQAHLTPTAHHDVMLTDDKASIGQDEDWLTKYERLSSMTSNATRKLQPNTSLSSNPFEKLHVTQAKHLETTNTEPTYSEEDDWLAKYERLTARTLALERSIAGISPMPLHQSNNDQSISPVRRLGTRDTTNDNVDNVDNVVNRDQGDMVGRTFDRESFVSRSSLSTGNSSIARLPMHLTLTQQQHQQQNLSLMSRNISDVAKIHPTVVERQRTTSHDRRFPNLGKDSDSYSDGDQVDFEGKTFHFVQSGSESLDKDANK